MLRSLLLLLLCAPLLAAAGEPPPHRALHALFEREFRYAVEEFPEYATWAGVEGHDHRLTDLSPAAIARRRQHTRRVIAELERIDPRRLNAQDRISRELMLEDRRLDAAYDALYGSLPFHGPGGWLVVGPRDGPQHQWADLAKAAPFRHVRDYDHWLQRLAAMPRALAQMTEQMRAGLRSGWLPPAAVMTKVPGQLEPFAGDDVTATPLYAPFRNLPPAIAAADAQRLDAAARRVLAERVHPAFAQFRRFVEHEYLPACTQSLAASALPGGPAYYALAVRQGTTTPLTPRQVHDIGVAEVERIGRELDRLVASLGYTKGRAEFMRETRADPRHYHADGDAMLTAYRDIAKRVDAELPKLFAELPRQPYGIRAMEPWEGNNAEYYSGGALDGSRAGWFNANVHNVRTRPRYEMESTFLHEAVPGHHLQTARAQELPGLPKFRRDAGYNAYAEGWALYAESLGPELGLYKDPYSRYGALSWEMVRAARLVVDTGLHAFGWSRERAIGYLVEHAGIAPDMAAGEVDRYVLWPGQALGYKIGELKIRELKARAQAALGARFDIRRFHNALLDDGALPLTVLERRIDEWIAAQRRGGSAGGRQKAR